MFTIHRGLLGGENRKTDGKTYTIDGVEHDQCPFCGNYVPRQFTICRGCGAERIDAFWGWIASHPGSMLLIGMGAGVLLAICMILYSLH